jgi:beta-hydroxylase
MFDTIASFLHQATGTLLLDPRFLVLYVFLLSTAYVHFRGRVRHSFVRQLTDHSTVMAPYNVLMYLFSRVPRDPVLPVETFPDLERLRVHWEVIRDEARRLYDAGHVKASLAVDDLAFNSFFRRGWKRFYLKWYGDFLPSAEQMCPETVKLLEAMPSINAAMFTLLGPGGRLPRHRDPFAGSMRYHLGLLTPNSDACYLDIDGHHLSWRDGEGLLFDETYIHTAVNETDQDRVILFCDVTRPLWFPPARWINRFMIHHVVKLTQTRNEEGEKVGAFNKAFGGVYKLRTLAKRVKAWNKKVYYVLKFVLLGGLLGLVLLW